jgi:hypothetical protein
MPYAVTNGRGLVTVDLGDPCGHGIDRRSVSVASVMPYGKRPKTGRWKHVGRLPSACHSLLAISGFVEPTRTPGFRRRGRNR